MNPFSSANPSTSAETAQDGNNAAEKFLTDVLEQEQQCLDEVIELLKVEHEAIIQRDTENMGRLLDKKLPLLSKLEQLDSQRQQLFQQLTGIPYNNEEFSRFIEHHPSKTIQHLWQTIRIKLPECKTQNELNGRIISIRQNNTEQILQILLGNPVNNAQTYSQLGQTSQQKRSAIYTAV